jgi:hypothetical protein
VRNTTKTLTQILNNRVEKKIYGVDNKKFTGWASGLIRELVFALLKAA